MKTILYATAIVCALTTACSTTSDTPQPETESISFVALPDDLTSIPDASFEPFLQMIGDASIIGISEGTHGMNEPLDFRNELIQFLVEQKRIDMVAIESGILESRIVHDYINGKEGDLDSVLVKGIMPGFNELEQNKELIQWLRDYNADASNTHKVAFYGFDIPGVPTNPWNEEVGIPIQYAMDFLQEVDVPTWSKYQRELGELTAYLHINPDPADHAKEYADLSEDQRKRLTQIVDALHVEFKQNKTKYISKTSQEDFDWALLAVVNAKWMDNFLREMIVHPESNYNEREQAMMDNLSWILERENKENIALFAHLAHLAKDMSMKRADGSEKLPKKMFGEYLGETFGDDYVVLANFYEELRYPDETAVVAPENIEVLFKHENHQNYYMSLDTSDTTYQRGWNCSIRWDSTHWHIVPTKAFDMVLWTQSQTYIDE